MKEKFLREESIKTNTTHEDRFSFDFMNKIYKWIID